MFFCQVAYESLFESPLRVFFPIHEPIGVEKGHHWAVGCIDFRLRRVTYSSSVFVQHDCDIFFSVRFLITICPYIHAHLDPMVLCTPLSVSLFANI
jgi:hypothetical protein